jgi:hypothetical protein
VAPTCRRLRAREGGGEGRPAVVLGQLGRKACWAALGGLVLLQLGWLERWAESEEGKG